MSDPVFYIDISTQLNDVYTGIGNVNHQIIKWFRAKHPAATLFFCYDKVIRSEVVDELLRRKSGRGLRAYLDKGLLTEESLASSQERHRDRPSAALFSTAKTSRRVFDFEAQIIHDLTVLLMPEFHHPSTIDHHGTSVEADLASDDLVICVSQNTRGDLETYLGVSPDRLMVAHLGIDDVERVEPTADVEPFILVLGTVEPRKNTALILATLRARPDLLARWRFVFAGHEGWGQSFASLIDDHKLGAYLGDRIVHLGFVAEAAKATLLANARCLLYPSIYEGFGLPVMEALHAGCPVITSRSSSLVEVGGRFAIYIDPHSVADLAGALDRLASEGDTERDERRAWAARFTWDRFCTAVHDRICHDLRSGPRREQVGFGERGPPLHWRGDHG